MKTYRCIYTKIMSKTKPQGDCLLWTGTVHSTGYGNVCRKNQMKYVHRIVFCWNNDLPKGYTVTHTCGNRLCVNPKHLKAISRKEVQERLHDTD